MKKLVIIPLSFFSIVLSSCKSEITGQAITESTFGNKIKTALISQMAGVGQVAMTGFSWIGDIIPENRVSNPENNIMNQSGLTATYNRSQRASLKPEITSDYVFIYEPQGDVFKGPDTENLVTGKYYPSWQPNDHCFIKDRTGIWHAFGITHPSSNPGERLHQGEYSLFHISPGTISANISSANTTGNVSGDLFAPGSWKDQPKVLNPSERPGENLFIFAPDIIKKDEQYVMIYGPAPLRMATSQNLLEWTPLGPIGVATNSSDRDPNFMLYDGVYYLTYCAGNSIRTATSTNLRDWTAPVEIFRPEKESYQCESPFLMHHEGMFYLFWCVWDSGDRNGNAYDDRTFVYCSDNPLDFKGKPLLAELKAHAPEIIRDDNGQWYISSAEYPKRGISIAKLSWK